MPAIRFADFPEFTPNLSPKEIFARGSFGGTYWRPITSAVTGKKHKNNHVKYGWDISPHLLTATVYDKSLNKYKTRVGTTLEFWEQKGWIVPRDPYGWVQWYSEFYNGRRTPDDARQIKRWQGVAGPTGRFKLRLQNMLKKGKDSAKIRQTLQHWAYKMR